MFISCNSRTSKIGVRIGARLKAVLVSRRHPFPTPIETISRSIRSSVHLLILAFASVLAGTAALDGLAA